MNPLKIALTVLLCLSLGACFDSIKDTHPDQVLTKRRALFKQFTRTMEPIGLMANGRKEYKADEFLSLAQELDKLSTKPWGYFTADGNYPPTRAKPEVWSKPAAFQKAQEQYQVSVQALVLAAQVAAQAGKADAALQQAVDGVTAQCKACHDNFRFQ